MWLIVKSNLTLVIVMRTKIVLYREVTCDIESRRQQKVLYFSLHGWYFNMAFVFPTCIVMHAWANIVYVFRFTANMLIFWSFFFLHGIIFPLHVWHGNLRLKVGLFIEKKWDSWVSANYRWTALKSDNPFKPGKRHIKSLTCWAYVLIFFGIDMINRVWNKQ